MTDLEHLCARHGVTTSYDVPDSPGQRRPVPEKTLHLLLEKLGPDPLPLPETLTPPRGVKCYIPDWLSEKPSWGLFCQLYELRSDRNWGIGDFRDLADLAVMAARRGADFLGVNPLHALFLGDPERRSPFSPSDRRFLNPLYIAVDWLRGAAAPPDLSELRNNSNVDYKAVTQIKLTALRAIHDETPFGDGAYVATNYASFKAGGGDPLRDHALYEALSLHQARQGRGACWSGWDAGLQDIHSDDVKTFAQDHAEEVEFHLWLQWIASVQLQRARDAACAAGMRIGLYLDLAVGEAPDGSATWAADGTMIDGFSIGAPPDVFATEGQNWGLAAPEPGALVANDCAAYRAMIGAQLDYAGALRIDHAMALWQLFLIPQGDSPASGAHLRYPFPDLVRALADLSHEQRTVMIGEDLGFVPDGFRAAMDSLHILSYRILYFEQADGGFKAPQTYPRHALACLSTHDLPTFEGWWRSEDIALRQQHGLVDQASSAAQLQSRQVEKARLLDTFAAAGLALPDDAIKQQDLPDDALVSAYRFIARTPCLLVGVRLADLVGPAQPTNLPGTIDAYPNWKLRCPVPLHAIADHPVFRSVTEAMSEERPRV